jgi:hypothetical protein
LQPVSLDNFGQQQYFNNELALEDEDGTYKINENNFKVIDMRNSGSENEDDENN